MISNAKTKANEFAPDFVPYPGATLSEVLDSLGMSQSELAVRMDRPRKTVSEIISGKTRILPDTALQLERVLGIKASFWLNLQSQWDEFDSRRREIQELTKHQEWASQFPYKAMSDFGWVPRTSDKTERVRNMLTFFGIASQGAWENLPYKNTVNFRRPANCDEIALQVWLQAGENIARKLDTVPYNEQDFRAVLERIRTLTQMQISDALKEMQTLCHKAGVIVLLVHELPKTASGATRWLSESALVQLSLRYKSDDQFWFSFFHEAAHLLQPKKHKYYITCDDDNAQKSEEELQADQWAANFLIPSKKYAVWCDKGDFSKQSIISFAQEIGIAPSIVLGRCQYDNHVSYKSPLNSTLKRKLNWNKIPFDALHIT